jgi:uncharacterized protein YndB with AHSA1/START domain
MSNKPSYALERSIIICAERSTVFRFFTDSHLFADWWGEGSTIEGRAGGSLLIRYPNGLLASGKVLQIEPPEHIVFSYGYDSGKPFPPGESVVDITLEEHADGTLLTLRHELDDPAVRDEHIQGWRYQLALFANVASHHQHSNVQQRLDDYFELWNTTNSAERFEKMNGLLQQDILFQDKHSCTSGLEDLNAHLNAYHHFMPGMSISRDGEVRECQGTVLCRWIANKSDGTRMASGRNVFVLSPSGLIQRVTGFWD